MGTGFFPGVKRPELGVDHPPHLASSLKKGYPSGPSWPVLHGELELYLKGNTGRAGA